MNLKAYGIATLHGPSGAEGPTAGMTIEDRAIDLYEAATALRGCVDSLYGRVLSRRASDKETPTNLVPSPPRQGPSGIVDALADARDEIREAARTLDAALSRL